MKNHAVERMLRDQPSPPPPSGLAERIKAEIPDQLPTMNRIGHSRRVVKPLPASWRLAAAAAVTVALTGAVTWQLWDGKAGIGPSDGRDKDATVVVEERRRIDAPDPTRSGLDASRQELVARGIDLGERTRGAGASGMTSTEGSEAGPKDSRFEDTRDSEKSISASSPESVLSRVPIPDPAPIDAFTNADAEVFAEEIQVLTEAPYGATGTANALLAPRPRNDKKTRINSGQTAVASGFAELEKSVAPSTGGTTEPNDLPYGDVFFREYGVNPFIDTEDDRLSTFGLDVDTGSYTVVRRYLRDGHLPPREAVRVEELVNSFSYGDPPPDDGDFALTAEGAPSPFGEGKRYKLLRFAITARVVDPADRPSALLVFVVDVSGSMNREDRLGLVKKALFELLANLRSDDRVGLVIYGSSGRVLLEPTTDHQAIRSAIDRLRAGGSTNAEEGLVLGYELADRLRGEETINRVILCSDGVANVGRTGPESILERIKGWADTGIELTTVGFGMGNYNDVLMERLADTGDGRYAYVDALPEAKRIFVDELTGTLMTIGSEAKAQVEFNPEVVSRYRLLGYENRDIADDRFRDPTVDAGEIGSGHTVTALYEVKVHENVSRRSKNDLATLRVRYVPRGTTEPVEIERRLRMRDLAGNWEKATAALRLASLVAEYAEILKGAYWAREGEMAEVLKRAQRLAPEFASDTRVVDWISLVAAAADLAPNGDPAPIMIEE